MRKSKLFQIMLIALVIASALWATFASLPDVNEAAIIKPTPPCSLCDNYPTPLPVPTRWCIHCDVRLPQ